MKENCSYYVNSGTSILPSSVLIFLLILFSPHPSFSSLLIDDIKEKAVWRLDIHLRGGADAYEEGEKGETALHWASYTNQIDAARILVKYQANIDIKDNNGNTPLHWAASQNSIKVAEFLISIGAQTNIRNKDFETPADYARKFSSLEMVSLLSKEKEKLVQNFGGGQFDQGQIEQQTPYYQGNEIPSRPTVSKTITGREGEVIDRTLNSQTKKTGRKTASSKKQNIETSFNKNEYSELESKITVVIGLTFCVLFILIVYECITSTVDFSKRLMPITVDFAKKLKPINLLWIGVTLICLMGLFPPWTQKYKPYEYRPIMEIPVGYHFLFNPLSPDPKDRRTIKYQIDISRLIIQCLIVGIITGAGMWTLKDRDK